jgi:hypothetical protein
VTDPVARLAAANPVDKRQLRAELLTGALARVWLSVDGAAAEPRPRRRQWRARTVVLIASAASTLALALALSAGPAPSLASTFPILAEHPANARSVGVGLGGPEFGEPAASDWTDFIRTAVALGELPAALRDAHAFPIPASYTAHYGANAAGYVAATHDGQRLCLAATARRWMTRGRDHYAFGTPVCASTAAVERDGLVDVIRHSTAVYGGVAFVALVPPGAAVTLTGNGLTAKLQILGGIAADVTWGPATLTITVPGRVERWPLA